MLLAWLGDRHDRDDLAEAARRLEEAIDAQIDDPSGRTVDLGGKPGTDAFGTEIARRIAG